jgi:uncharacterized protein (UPF0264 family)
MRLLVSVADASEVRAAIDGGADIIDAKDASRGALGAVAPAVLAAIVAAVGGERPVSAAVGDAGDVAGIGLPTSSVTTRVAGSEVPGVSFVKLGFAAGVDARQGAVYAGSVAGALRGTGTAVVLAAYADAASDRLGRDAILDIAVGCGAAGVLLDTLDKQRGQPLFALLDPEVVADWVVSAQQAGLSVALAGSLGASDVALARDIGADVVGVRGAACDGGRLGRVSVGRLRGLLRQVAGTPVSGVREPSPRSIPAMGSPRVRSATTASVGTRDARTR